MQQISTLLEKVSHWDKDERYMAANDLSNLLQKDSFILDELTEKKLGSAVLTLLGNYIFILDIIIIFSLSYSLIISF